MWTLAKVGGIGPCLKKKALYVLDQKKQAALSMSSSEHEFVLLDIR
jgi:hypothetical protein